MTTLISKNYNELHQCDGKVAAFDTETTGLDVSSGKSVMIGLSAYCPQAGVEKYYICDDDRERRDLQKVFRELTPAWSIFHNVKFDCHALNIRPAHVGGRDGKILDTSTMIHALDGRYPKSLEKAEEIFLGKTEKKYHVEAQRNKMVWTWPREAQAPYAVNDTISTYQLAKVLQPKLDQLIVWDLVMDEMRYADVLWRTERHGLPLDFDFLEVAEHSLMDRLTHLESELYAAVGQEFNWRSHKQLAEALYDIYGWPRPKNPHADVDGVDHSLFASKGVYNSTLTSTFLLMEKAKHPLGELVSNIREAHKLVGNIKKWIELSEDGIIHFGFNANGTRTGRLSSSRPNGQNLPSDVRGRFTQSEYSGSMERSEEFNLRTAFCARPGYSLMGTDYSQMELRFLGILSDEPTMLESLNAGRDIHADVAETIWGIRDKVHREWAKTISFSLVYGASAGSLAHRLGISYKEAKKIFWDYNNTFPAVGRFMDDTINHCKQFGFLRMWHGRLWFEEDPMKWYKGANALIQGGCSGILREAAFRTMDWLESEHLENDIHIVNYIHDELMLEVPTEMVPYAARKMHDIMWMEDLFNAPWYNSSKVGPSYGELRKWDDEKGDFKTEFKEEEILVRQ